LNVEDPYFQEQTDLTGDDVDAIYRDIDSGMDYKHDQETAYVEDALDEIEDEEDEARRLRGIDDDALFGTADIRGGGSDNRREGVNEGVSDEQQQLINNYNGDDVDYYIGLEADPLDEQSAFQRGRRAREEKYPEYNNASLGRQFGTNVEVLGDSQYSGISQQIVDNASLVPSMFDREVKDIDGKESKTLDDDSRPGLLSGDGVGYGGGDGDGGAGYGGGGGGGGYAGRPRQPRLPSAGVGGGSARRMRMQAGQQGISRGDIQRLRQGSAPGIPRGGDKTRQLYPYDVPTARRRTRQVNLIRNSKATDILVDSILEP
jgi:hypothetical protein